MLLEHSSSSFLYNITKSIGINMDKLTARGKQNIQIMGIC